MFGAWWLASCPLQIFCLLLAAAFEIICTISLEQDSPWGILPGCKGKLERNWEMMRKLLMMLTAAAALGACVSTEKVGGCKWTYRISGGTAENMV